MSEQNQIRIILTITALIVPYFFDLHHPLLYTIVAICVFFFGIIRIVKEQWFEQRFITRWEKIKQKGFWANFIRASIGGFIVMSILTFAIQFLAYGRTSVAIYKQLSQTDSYSVFVIMVVTSVAMGIASWFDNNRKYQRIKHRERNDI